MADLPYSAVLGDRTYASAGTVSVAYAANANSSSIGAPCTDLTAPQFCVRMHEGEYGGVLYDNTGRDDTDGVSSPCLRMVGYSKFRFRVAVAAGARTATVYAKQPYTEEAQPILRVIGNADIGVSTQEAAALPSGGWTVIGPISFTASANGGLFVEIINPAVGRTCWFDNLVVQ